MNDLAVLIPAYKANDTIVRCLRSLAVQSYKRFDVLLILDGEDEEFPYKECCETIEGPIKWGQARPEETISGRKFLMGTNAHQGTAKTRNDLLNFAENYKYLAWQDADDESETERLRLQVEYLEAHPQIFMVGTWMNVYNDGIQGAPVDTPTDPAVIRAAYQAGHQGVSGATAMFRRAKLDAQWKDEELTVKGYGLRFREDLPIGQDFVFNLEAQKRWPLCQANLGLRLYRYYRHPGGAVRRYRAEAEAGRAIPIEQFMQECVKKYG